MLEITRWPVIVVANYRSSSSPFLNAIREEHNLGEMAFIEPTSGSNKLQPFLDCYYSDNKQYAIKIIVDQIDDIIEYRQLLLSDCFKVRLIREDEVNQIVSYYIAKKRDIWFQRPWEIVNDYTIELDDNFIKECIEIICKNNRVLETLPVLFDVTCTYQSLGYLAQAKANVPTTMPINLSDIKNRVEYLYAHR
jgi:hypothetical protein